MIRLKPFKLASLMPSNRRPIFASVNDAVRGYTIRSDGFITAYPCPAYFSYTISSRCRRRNYDRIF